MQSVYNKLHYLVMTQAAAAEGLCSADTPADLWYRAQNRQLHAEAIEINTRAELILHVCNLIWNTHKIWLLSVWLLKLHLLRCIFLNLWHLKVKGSTMFSFFTSLIPTSYFIPEWLTFDTNPVDSLLQGELLICSFSLTYTFLQSVSVVEISVFCDLQDW